MVSTYFLWYNPSYILLPQLPTSTRWTDPPAEILQPIKTNYTILLTQALFAQCHHLRSAQSNLPYWVIPQGLDFSPGSKRSFCNCVNYINPLISLAAHSIPPLRNLVSSHNVHRRRCDGLAIRERREKTLLHYIITLQCKFDGLKLERFIWNKMKFYHVTFLLFL